MAQQLVLLQVEKRAPRRSRGAKAGSARATFEWQLDDHTIAVGRRGLQEARQALRAASPQAA